MAFVAPTLQPEHGYVILVVVLVAVVNFWAGVRVLGARKKFNINYPQMYAEKSDEHCHEFNCYQRAHQNVLENLPVFLALLFVSSVYRPTWAAIAGFVRVVGFVVYVIGYSTGEPGKRQYGAFGFIAFFASMGLAVEAACRLISA
ncbi:hypothetical protein H310_01804 [Aphanomyces invadans]|uniref:Glutathione S-transferase 3, mitochondrial n=1 Tax=Aphanomyces invadans TaxID=157072 RepID=A0A024ULQ9_9STRA|nr:hypothetical protein H310_01804 [Aphanomyces invadans]ETW07239.1 hypothetical protein H310_01804 [Aphanomyces invadans]|eukprot:XP_008863332.1 hypothetical protein H310_01804 [Aphanomyces invadans]